MKAQKTIFPFFAVLLALALVSCNRERYEPLPEPSQVRKVLLMYCEGYNNLSSDIYEDIRELCTTLPGRKAERFHKVLVFSHLTRPSGATRDDTDYSTPCNPVLIDAYTDESGNIVADTVKIFPADMRTSSAEAVGEVLNYVREHYPAREYGMIMSSHGTGWLPRGYYDTSDDDVWEFCSPGPLFSPRHPVLPESSYGHPLEGPRVKSMACQAYRNEAGKTCTYEIEMCDFAASIPLHLKYLILDMCLMGGIELAYELSGKVDFLVVSPTEVLAGGFRYDTAVERLLFAEEPDLEAFCSDYFHKYKDEGSSATVSLIDCNRLENLASVCGLLFEKYRDKMGGIDARDIQGYFRADKHWFYDLRDVLVHCGISAQERASLDAALSECVLYNEATERFISFPISTHCGLSMYFPGKGSEYLDGFYRDFRWNKATSLVK